MSVFTIRRSVEQPEGKNYFLQDSEFYPVTVSYRYTIHRLILKSSESYFLLASVCVYEREREREREKEGSRKYGADSPVQGKASW
jgi:hypothetical protein